MDIPVDDAEREAARRAAQLLERQAEGLKETGSVVTVRELTSYIATLRRIAEAPSPVSLTSEEKNQIEQAGFVLIGLQSGLAGADFESRAQAIRADIRQLNRIVTSFNTAAMNAKGARHFLNTF
jgi:hypothetical protein